MGGLKTSLARSKRGIVKTALTGWDAILNTDHAVRYVYQLNGFHDPDYRFPKDKINFIHVPKTGGTSLHKMLDGKTENILSSTVHRPVSKHCPPAEYDYVTIMRHPVARVWSQYQMVLRNPKGTPYRNFAEKGLECFLKKCWAVNDMACQYYSSKTYEKGSPIMLEIAKENLSHFKDVLAFESFSDEVPVFLKKHGISFKAMAHERKATYTSYTEKESELMQSYNKFDMQLYHHWKTTRKHG